MIDVRDHGDVRELRLNRPPANALSPELLERLCAHVVSAPSEGARALVISGAGGMFTGGLDVPLLLRLDRAGMMAAWATFHGAMQTLATAAVPVVAAITGHSPGGGLVLALFCDYRVQARGAFKIGLNEVAVGIPLPRVIFAALRRQVGPRVAEALAVTGALLDPDAALKVGLIDELAPPEEVVDRAVAWCRQLLGAPPHAMRDTRAMARADLAALFAGLDAAAIAAELDRCWYAGEAQQTLAALVRRLTERR